MFRCIASISVLGIRVAIIISMRGLRIIPLLIVIVYYLNVNYVNYFVIYSDSYCYLFVDNWVCYMNCFLIFCFGNVDFDYWNSFYSYCLNSFCFYCTMSFVIYRLNSVYS